MNIQPVKGRRCFSRLKPHLAQSKARRTARLAAIASELESFGCAHCGKKFTSLDAFDAHHILIRDPAHLRCLDRDELLALCMNQRKADGAWRLSVASPAYESRPLARRLAGHRCDFELHARRLATVRAEREAWEAGNS